MRDALPPWLDLRDGICNGFIDFMFVKLTSTINRLLNIEDILYELLSFILITRISRAPKVQRGRTFAPIERVSC